MMGTDWSGRRWRWGLAGVALSAILIRAWMFGYPLIDVDEEFYLLTGDRMLHGGALPYVDIWDRKPPGLFALYAAIRLLGGTGIVQYQVVAALFVAATAILIAILARRIAHPAAALAAGFAYAPALAAIGGGGAGGQTPVFYNLLVAGGALILLDLASPRNGSAPGPATIRRQGLWVMLLVGVAMQLKPTAVFEGIYFGLVLLWLAWRADPRPLARAGDALLWIVAALVPTLLALAIYAGIGHAPEFLYANVGSIFARNDGPAASQWHDFQHILGRIAPLLVPIVVGEWLMRRQAPWRLTEPARDAHRFLAGWAGAATFGFLIFGTYFNHYALPLLPPFAVLAAAAFSIRRQHAGPVLAVLALGFLLVRYPLDFAKYEKRRGDRALAGTMADIIRPRLHGGCLYVFYGEPILYHLTGSCLPTRWSFPFHLSLEREAKAIGVDAVAETRRIMATKPPVIVDRLNDDEEINHATQDIVRAGLARDYRLIFTFHHDYGDNGDTEQIWERRPGR